jgi:hydroxyacylglutathione hydrolase
LLKPLDKLTALAGDLSHERPLAVHCKSGYRSAIGASLLQREGFRQVYNVTGGFDAWQASGLACVRPELADGGKLQP